MREELAAEHLATYDALAREYEERAEALLPVTRAAVDWMRPHLRAGGEILDLGSGAGLGARCFLEYGFRMTCLDLSPEMLALATRRNPEAACLQGDFLKTTFDAPFDGIFAFAFIHLFPKTIAQAVLKKIGEDLRPSGVALVGSTVSEESGEGWEIKSDYVGEHRRFRKHWTKPEFTEALLAAGFDIVKQEDHRDPFGKEWMDFIVRRPVISNH